MNVVISGKYMSCLKRLAILFKVYILATPILA